MHATAPCWPPAACAKRSIPQCPGYAVAADTSCAYCVNKTRLIISGPNAGKCAAPCQAGQVVFNNGTCGSCPAGMSMYTGSTVCITSSGKFLMAPLDIEATEATQPVLMKAALIQAACPPEHYDCGPVCVKLPAPVLGSVCYATMKDGGASKWPECK
jgi:hypothetical protein